MLGRACFFDESHAAMDLYTQRGGLHAHFRAKPLDQWHQKFCDSYIGRILPTGCKSTQSTAAFGRGTHMGQHPADIGVMNDGDRPLGAAVNRAALKPGLCIGQRLLIGACAYCNPLNAHRKPGCVHHNEHIFQPGVFVANQKTRCPFKFHHAGRAGPDAQLVLNALATNGVVRASCTVVTNQIFGHQKQADPLDAFGRVQRAGQHQMDDIVGQIMVTVSDVDLGAGDPVGAILLPFGAAAQQCQITSRLRLGQVHRAGPRARHQFRQVGLLHLWRAKVAQRLNRAIGQQGA